MPEKKRKRSLSMKVFSSLEEENRAEHKRLAAMTPEERLKEFGELQARVWGKKWTEERMVKKITYEKVPWYDGGKL